MIGLRRGVFFFAAFFFGAVFFAALRVFFMARCYRRRRAWRFARSIPAKTRRWSG